jgi:hypothetical protein
LKKISVNAEVIFFEENVLLILFYITYSINISRDFFWYHFFDDVLGRIDYAQYCRIVELLIIASMQKMNFSTNAATVPKMMGAGKPSMPLMARQPFIERKTSDPSSTAPKGERYPIPSFFEYRIKPRDYDPL